MSEEKPTTKPAKERRERHPLDPEVAAINKGVRLMESVTGETRVRLVEYLYNRYRYTPLMTAVVDAVITASPIKDEP